MHRLRSPLLAALMVTLVLLVSGAHLLHEQRVPHAVGEHCDLCRFGGDASGMLRPLARLPVVIPASPLRQPEPGLACVWPLPVVPAARSPPSYLLAV